MVLPRTESNSTEELPANIAYFGVRLAPARERHSSVARNLWSQQIKQTWTLYLNQCLMRNLFFLYLYTRVLAKPLIRKHKPSFF